MRIVLATLLCGALAAPAAAQGTRGFGDHWSLGARGGVVVTDQAFDADGAAWAVTIGRTFGPQYAIEVELSGDDLDFGIDYGLRHRAIGVNHLTINREPLWDPYFLIGIGLIEFDAPPGNAVREGRDFMFNLGIGGQWELVAPERVLLRADLRLRYDRNDTGQPGQNGFGDGIFSLGLTVPFGR
jgi:hypothetical protein